MADIQYKDHFTLNGDLNTCSQYKQRLVGHKTKVMQHSSLHHFIQQNYWFHKLYCQYCNSALPEAISYQTSMIVKELCHLDCSNGFNVKNNDAYVDYALKTNEWEPMGWERIKLILCRVVRLDDSQAGEPHKYLHM